MAVDQITFSSYKSGYGQLNL